MSIESKSLLAKLMATENLIVEHRNVQTAAFDVKNRVLVIPQLDKNISGYLYDMFVGHEVGHALYTPLDGITRAWEMKIPQSITNCVEDSRIERKIKNKYPGIRASFVKGYKELIEKDFFGTKGIDLNTLPFLDRLNMFCKGGPSQNIKFNDIEKALVDAVESTETYDEVIEVSQKLATYVKAEKEAKRKMMADAGIEEEDEEEYDEYEFDDEDGEFGFNDFDDEGKEQETNVKEYSENQDKNGEVNEGKEIDEASTAAPSDHDSDNDVRSLTDDAYRQNEKKLFAQDDGSYYYGNIPKLDLKRVILDYKDVYAKHRECRSRYDENSVDTKQYQKFRIEANKVVSYLAKEFELRKNADQMKRASTAKTGELNMNKIFSYKFNDDIFKKLTVLPGGKSHGLVMFIDWSGSMSNHIENTVKQLLSLVLFCKKVNIPYEVYAFSDQFLEFKNPAKHGEIALHHFRLLNFLSSRMSAIEFTNAASTLLEVSSNRYRVSSVFSMGGTPLNETIIAAMQIIPEFQKKYKLQIVNTVFLTDGEGHRLDNVYRDYDTGMKAHIGNNYNDSYYGKTRPTLIIRDLETKHQVVLQDQYNPTKLTAAYIEMLKLKTGCNIIGFYVLSGRDFTRASNHLLPRAADVEALKVKFRKEKSLVINSAGYDEYYLLRSEALDTEDDVEFEVKENATTRGLVSAFSKYTKNRQTNRVILNRFIGMIS
jgi:hypothetical protein